MPKKVLVALPPGLLEQIDLVADVEHRNRSDLIRETLRRYLEEFRKKEKPVFFVQEKTAMQMQEV